LAPGDNLFRIALRHGTTVSALVRANGLRSPDRIYAGQRLTIASPVGRTGTSGALGPGAHLVRAEDNLFRIALRYGTTVPALVRANGLRSPDKIFVGQRLVIPTGGSAAPYGAAPGAGGATGRYIIIDLSSQRLTAMANGHPVATFVVSTGRPGMQTPVGRFRIYSRYISQRMVGPGYDLPGVPHVQYFTGNYAIHGTYWHGNFGVPVSHGCVNLRPADAAWLWQWSQMGTPVTVRW